MLEMSTVISHICSTFFQKLLEASGWLLANKTTGNAHGDDEDNSLHSIVFSHQSCSVFFIVKLMNTSHLKCMLHYWSD